VTCWAYYNENDPFAAQWLRNLMAARLIMPGHVDERSIEDVRPDDLRLYVRCHFFAGIGGWDYALQIAGWPSDRPVWTGSCPCQPFSAAGRRRGEADKRHLWPAWFHLISASRPDCIFGEQVASAAALGWLDTVLANLEAADYATGAADLCAAGVGAPHVRQRLYWVAHAKGVGWSGRADDGDQGGWQPPPGSGSSFDVWQEADWLRGADGLERPVEPGACPLADGVPARMGKLRAYGNAIVPQVAAAFILAAKDLMP